MEMWSNLGFKIRKNAEKKTEGQNHQEIGIDDYESFIYRKKRD